MLKGDHGAGKKTSRHELAVMGRLVVTDTGTAGEEGQLWRRRGEGA